MLGIQRIGQLLLVGSLSLVILASCITDESDPTEFPLFLPTATPSGGEQEASGTEEAAETPEADATENAEPEDSPGPSPTPPPIEDPAPSGDVEIPDDLQSILPTLEDLPEGLEVANEGEADVTFAASDFEDPEARAQLLEDWGFQEAAFRELSLPDDQETNEQGQLLVVLAQAMVLGSPEAAQLEMHSFIDEVVLNDPNLDTEELTIDPLGDIARAAVGRPADEGEQRRITVLSVVAGPVSLRFITASSGDYDSLPDIIAAAEAGLSRLNYSAVPALGEVLLETDFSDWATGEVDSGMIEYDEEAGYRLTVNQGEGAFVFARSSEQEPFTDIAVSVETRMLSEDPAAQACVLTRVAPEDQRSDYAFCIDGAGNFGANYEETDGEGNYNPQPLLRSDGVTVPEPVDWTKLTIIARGNEFWFLINDELVGRVQHEGSTEGSVGVLVSSFVTTPDTPVQFEFNNLVVQAVE